MQALCVVGERSGLQVLTPCLNAAAHLHFEPLVLLDPQSTNLRPEKLFPSFPIHYLQPSSSKKKVCAWMNSIVLCFVELRFHYIAQDAHELLNPNNPTASAFWMLPHPTWVTINIVLLNPNTDWAIEQSWNTFFHVMSRRTTLQQVVLEHYQTWV